MLVLCHALHILLYERLSSLLVKMALELSSKTTNPKSGKVNEVSQRYSVDIFFIIYFNSYLCAHVYVLYVWMTHVYLGVCVYM